MIFQGFTQQTSDFLWELAFNNERSWFLSHKDVFEQCLNQPLKLLAQETFAQMQQQYPRQDLKLHISRIYRDARRLHGRGPYKDHLWFTIKKSSELLEGPCFWFEIGAADYSYGMGFYSAKSAQMAAFRRLVDANPAAFERLIRRVTKNRAFVLTGEAYKKPKGSHSEIIDPWYNRKQLGLECSRDFGGDLLRPEFPSVLAEAYGELMPMYEFFLRFYHADETEQNQLQGGTAL